VGYRNDIYDIRVRRLPLCRIPHSYALLRRIALSTVVCRSFCRSVSLSALQKRWNDQVAICVPNSGGPSEPRIKWDPDANMGRGNFDGKQANHCKV